MGRTVRTISGLVSALLLVGVFVGTAVANHCAGCIDTKDLAGQAVTSGKIKDGTIQGKDIKTGSVGGRAIENGKVKAVDLHASAKAAAGTIDLVGSTDSATADTIDSFTISVPAPGMLYIHASGTFYFDVNAGADESLVESGSLGLCTAADSLSLANCGGGLFTGNSVFYQESEDASPEGDNHTPFFSLTRVLDVAKGDTTVYLNGTASDTGDLNLWTARASILFVPGELSVS